MAQAASTFADDEPIERRPGDFQRSKTGTPYVADPTGATVKSGPRKGLVKTLPYGRPSGFGKQIESTYNLQKWSERTVALGLGVDYVAACEALAAPSLVTKAAELVNGDRDTKEWKSDADAVVIEAKRLAKAGIAAERGTQAHALTEDDDEERDWIARAEHGEVLGLDRGVQQSLVEAWREMLDRDGLEVLAVEFAMVHDGYRMAGTGDRIARLTRPLRFTMIGGEIVELPAGTVLVLDIKTGQRRMEPNGTTIYWASYAVQIATYAGGVLYDPDTDTRTPYPWPVDQHWALIAHLDVLGAIEGNPSCTLVLVDIEAGRAAADLCMAAKAWEKRSDVFSIAPISEAVADAPDEPQQQAQEATPAPAPAVAMTQQEIVARLRRHPDIDEGKVSDPEQLDRTFARMAELFIGLDVAAKAWAAELQNQAQMNGCGFHAREAHTLRRFEIIRGLIALAAAELDDDYLIRHLVEYVTGDDVAQSPPITPGHALGAMNAEEASRFAVACDQLVADQIVLTFTASGRPQFVERRAA